MAEPWASSFGLHHPCPQTDLDSALSFPTAQPTPLAPLPFPDLSGPPSNHSPPIREQPDSTPLGWFLFTLGIKLKFLNLAQRPSRPSLGTLPSLLLLSTSRSYWLVLCSSDLLSDFLPPGPWTCCSFLSGKRCPPYLPG